MVGDLIVVMLFPDGSAPEVFTVPETSLSAKWTSICEDVLTRNGPVFTEALEGQHSHLGIMMGGPMGRLSVRERACFEFGIVRGVGDELDRASARRFGEFVLKACAAAGKRVSSEATEAIVGPATSGTLLMFDYCAEVDEQDKTAAAQLGFHLASAYVKNFG